MVEANRAPGLVKLQDQHRKNDVIHSVPAALPSTKTDWAMGSVGFSARCPHDTCKTASLFERFWAVKRDLVGAPGGTRFTSA